MIIAKPVVDKQFWILQDGNEKVGNVEAAQGGGFNVKINDTIQQYKTIKMVTQLHNIVFEQIEKPKKKSIGNEVHGYEARGKVCNPVWDVKHRLPLFTRDNKSKSWYAAGWYQVQRGRSWKIVQDPKLITLQRYKYHGPFRTKEEVSGHVNR